MKLIGTYVSPYAAVIAVGVTILLWSAAFPGIRAALTSFTPSELAFLRFAIASIAVGAYWLARRPALPRRRDLPRIILAGVLGITAYNLLLNFGQLTVSAGAASFLVNLAPVFALILGVALAGERVTLWALLGMLLSFCGVAMIAFGGSRELRFDYGAVFIVAAAFCFALSFVVQKPLLAHIRPIGVTTGMIWAATATLLPFAPSAVAAIPNASVDAIIALVFLGLGPSMLAYLAWSHALTQYPVTRATSFLYLVPPVTLTVSFFWVDEVPNLLTAVGGVLTLAGVIIVNTFGRRVPPSTAASESRASDTTP